MGGIPGAREELDRLGRALRTQLVELINDLTPGSDLRLLFLDEPTIVDWHEPLRYQYGTSSFSGERPAHASAADIASRAATLLGSAGWEVATSQEDAGGRPRSVVTGRRDGCSIEIRVGHHRPVVYFDGRTPAMALYEPEEFQWPEPVCTAETVTPGYVLCYECDGLGWCPGCGGRGWVHDEVRGRKNCSACHRDRVCLICRGAAQLAISQLSPYQRGYYPELG
ncbi:hypothetical protein FGW37_00640 [Streptomyces rectiverticillatus]|uniref:hypothetical protein n=1 Tax=Streptomyces rectiverticillatus TaxID=173860 RepID=UPI0015C2C9CD|nr:hypothetical protein [Streptomyces rectiverticillatus]QLE70312.1 hypothetical protein FGW37_00640 [Streptomyces rectiverticillatus]